MAYVSPPVVGPRRRLSVSAKPGDEVLLRIPAGLARLRLHTEGIPDGTARFQLITPTGGYLLNQDESTRMQSGFIAIPGSEYRTDEFVPGSGYVILRAKGFGARLMAFTAPELVTTDVTIRFDEPGEVAGRVLVPKTAKYEIASMKPVFSDADPQTNSWVRQTMGGASPVAEDRMFRMPSVQPGTYEITFMRSDDGQWTRGTTARIDVRSGETARARSWPLIEHAPPYAAACEPWGRAGGSSSAS